MSNYTIFLHIYTLYLIFSYSQGIISRVMESTKPFGIGEFTPIKSRSNFKGETLFEWILRYSTKNKPKFYAGSTLDFDEHKFINEMERKINQNKLGSPKDYIDYEEIKNNE